MPRPLEEAIGFTIHIPCSLVKAAVLKQMYMYHIQQQAINLCTHMQSFLAKVTKVHIWLLNQHSKHYRPKKHKMAKCFLNCYTIVKS